MNSALSAGPLETQKLTSGIAMPVRRKVFRIEEMQGTSAQVEPEPFEQQQREMLAELAALRELITQRPAPANGGDDHCDLGDRPQHPQQQKGLRQLKDETALIHRAITRTKEEIAALHVSGLDGADGNRVSRELGAVAGGAEHAIQQILAAAEDIDEAANTLSAALKQEQERALAQDIRDQVVRIFEASNFQDLAGQRINKVLATLKFVEDRIAHMMEIWGGIDAFKDYTDAALAARKQGSVLLNGPKLEGDAGHASQDDIDRIFQSE
jgi:chemotaxis protein CheZ